MPCRRDGSTESFEVPPGRIHDWADLHPYSADGTYQPKSLADLVVIVQQIEKTARAKAVGSIWSLSRAPDSDGFVIYTDRLNKQLSRPVLPGSVTKKANFDEVRYDSENNDAPLLAGLDRPGWHSHDTGLIHVQAGIKIKDLLVDLRHVGLALPTMGGGGGQSLAGAISTSTHGSDLNLPPLGDFVRAIHLVGPGGQEWWIESNGGAGQSVSYSQYPDWCSDTKIVRDRDFLESVMVGIGRFGVIYSVVLEVVPSYRLEERRDKGNWSALKGDLEDGRKHGYASEGEIFDDLRSCDEAPKLFEPIRFWSAVIDLASGEDVYFVRRWVTHCDKDIESPSPAEQGGSFLGFLCSSYDWALSIVLSITQTAVNALHLLAIQVSLIYSPIPFAGPWLSAEHQLPFVSLAADLVAAATDFETLGSWLGTVIDRTRHWIKDDDSWPNSAAWGIISDLISGVWEKMLSSNEGEPPIRRGESHEILDTHNYEIDGCFSVDSSEFFFDATDDGYILFLDKVVKRAQADNPVTGVAALRFMRRTVSKIGMQRFSRTASVEVAISRPGSINDAFMNDVQNLALANRGIPHWGQEHHLTRDQVETLYPKRSLEDWRWALSETEKPHPKAFSSDFTRDRGLEAIEHISASRARRYLASVASPL